MAFLSLLYPMHSIEMEYVGTRKALNELALRNFRSPARDPCRSGQDGAAYSTATAASPLIVVRELCGPIKFPCLPLLVRSDLVKYRLFGNPPLNLMPDSSSVCIVPTEVYDEKTPSSQASDGWGGGDFDRHFEMRTSQLLVSFICLYTSLVHAGQDVAIGKKTTRMYYVAAVEED